MKITDIQDRSDGGYYATIDGQDVELTGGETCLPGDDQCDYCGARTTWNDDGEPSHVIYSDDMGQVMLCGECIEACRPVASE